MGAKAERHWRSRVWASSFWAVACFYLGLGAAQARSPVAGKGEPRLGAGSAELRLEADVGNGDGYGVALFLDGTAAFRQASPLALQLDAAAGTVFLQGRYSQVTQYGTDSLVAQGTLRSANGTSFTFLDAYTAPGADGVFHFVRQVSILAPAAGDKGFATRFSLPLAAPAAYSECEFLIPGHLYRDTASMTANALAADYRADDIFIREDRMPLPLILLRHKATGITLLFQHRGPDGGTILGESTGKVVTDARLQFASLGIHDRTRPSAGMWFPGSEGDRSYYGQGGWAYRRHPVLVGVPHRYSATLRISRTAEFAVAAEEGWRFAYDAAPPALRRVDLAKVRSASLDLLTRSWKAFDDGSAGFPFSIRIPDGVFGAYAMQMGFIGQNLPGANELLRAGLKDGKQTLIDQGERMLGFWSTRSAVKQGIPAIWYDAGKSFRPDPTFLRIATDGMLGALRAWRTMRSAGRERPAWLVFARVFGDWLVAHQNPDGSFYRQYDYNTGEPAQTAKTNTLHPVPFLCELYRATEDFHYRESALKAGEYAWADVHTAYRYVGGTADNPNVRDKEAGILSLDAFLALHDLTGDARWLAAARQAAAYVETWTYAWPVPVVPGDDSTSYPGGRDQSGLSLIALGHSGADNFMAYCPFAFFRLWVETGDRHYLDIARFLLHNTKQGMDWDPMRPMGYAYPGLQTEVGTVCSPRGHSIKIWLPWVTVVSLIPMSQLEDTFGSQDVDSLSVLSVESLRAMDATYALTRGYGPGLDPVVLPLRPNVRSGLPAGHDALGRIRSHLGALKILR